MFEWMLSVANHLGLYAEETGSVGRPWASFRKRLPIWL
jgi:hypothetical protein